MDAGRGGRNVLVSAELNDLVGPNWQADDGDGVRGRKEPKDVLSVELAALEVARVGDAALDLGLLAGLSRGKRTHVFGKGSGIYGVTLFDVIGIKEAVEEGSLQLV